MSEQAMSVIRWMLGIAGLCVVALAALAALGKAEVEVVTILGGTIATIVGAVAGVVVGQKVLAVQGSSPLLPDPTLSTSDLDVRVQAEVPPTGPDRHAAEHNDQMIRED